MMITNISRRKKSHLRTTVSIESFTITGLSRNCVQSAEDEITAEKEHKFAPFGHGILGRSTYFFGCEGICVHLLISAGRVARGVRPTTRTNMTILRQSVADLPAAVSCLMTISVRFHLRL